MNNNESPDLSRLEWRESQGESTMALVFRRQETESWKEAMLRYARRFYMENDVLETYERLVRTGETEDRAAWSALYEWDLLDSSGNSGGEE